MKIAEFLPAIPNQLWDLAAQIGVSQAICKCAPDLTGLKAPDDFESLRVIHERFAERGFTLAGLEGDQFDMNRIKFGLPGREADVERYRNMLENMGRLGIPLLCYNFMAGIGWHRNDTAFPLRGGALGSSFDRRTTPDTLTEFGTLDKEALWENYAWFIEQVMPTAEAAGVKMGLHPDDPPVDSLRDIARIMSSTEGFRRALSLSNSPSHGLTYCQANFTLLGDADRSLLREFRERVHFVHFRDVRGTAECFHETFHDDGPTDMAAMIRLYREIGFEGPIRVDHVPTMAGEANDHPGYGALGRLFAVGYLKGILDATA
jgi:mannonate dehydratase